MVDKNLTSQISNLIKNIVEQNNLLFIDLIVRGTDKHPVIEVFVDHRDGVDTELCSKISLEIKEKLDQTVEIDNYRLDVSSPGVDRPLIYLEQYFKHIGRKFSLQYKENDNTYELNNATLESINNDELTFKTNKSTIKLKFSQIIKAQTIITF